MFYRDENNEWQELVLEPSGDTLPIGAIVSYGSLTAPTNWLVCDGSAVSRTTYAYLFAVIGTSYGSGDGSTTFNLPDLRGRVPVGKSTDTEFDVLGETGGEKTHTLTINEMPNHEHSKETGTGTGQYNYNVSGLPIGTDPSTLKTTAVGGGQAHNNLQPYQVVCFIIKAEDAAGVVANVTNTKNDSTKDTYSCDYINDIVEEIYSTSEVKTNKVWVNGKPIYRKVYTVGAVSTTATISLDMDISTITITSLEAIYYSTNGSVLGTNYANPGSANAMVGTRIAPNNDGVIFIICGQDNPISSGYVTLEYTKTTD